MDFSLPPAVMPPVWSVQSSVFWRRRCSVYLVNHIASRHRDQEQHQQNNQQVAITHTAFLADPFFFFAFFFFGAMPCLSRKSACFTISSP